MTRSKGESIKEGVTIYTSNTLPAFVKYISGNLMEVTVEHTTTIYFDGRTESQKWLEHRTLKQSEYGKTWFFSRAEAHTYMMELEAQRRKARAREMAPDAPLLTEKMLFDLQETYKDRYRSWVEEVEWYKTITAVLDKSLTKNKQQNKNTSAAAPPYFARMDFRTKYENDDYYDKIYLGYHEIKENDKVLVYDWRTQIGDLFYKKEKIFERIEINGYRYDYELLLRRRFSFEEGNLSDIYNEFVVGDDPNLKITDDFLLSVLRARTWQPGMRDIVQTIQANQNHIIRQNLHGNFIVQGCAGSGKTMIMVHRLSYLKLQYKDLKLSDIRILTPSKHFNLELSDLASFLEIQTIPLLSIPDYYFELLGRYNLKVKQSDKRITPENKIPKSLLTSIYSAIFRQSVEEKYQLYLNKLIKDLKFQSAIQAAKELDIKLPDRPAAGGQAILAYYHRVAADVIALQNKYLADESDLQRKLDKVRDEKKIFLESYKLANKHFLILQEYNRILDLDKEYRQMKLALTDLENSYRDKVEKTKDEIDQLEQALKDCFTFNYFEKSRLKKKIAYTQYRLNELTNKTGFVCLDYQQKKQALENSLSTLHNAITVLLHEQKSGDVEEIEKEVTRINATYNSMNQIKEKYELLLSDEAEIEKNLALIRESMLPDDLYQVVLQCRNTALPEFNNMARDIYRSIRSELLHSIPSKQKNRIYKFDWYILLFICFFHYGPLNKPDYMLNIDEGQDLSAQEYNLLREVHGPDILLNVYGDVKQCIFPEHGIRNWEQLKELNFPVFELKENYRNSMQITQFVSSRFSVDMMAIGLQQNPVNLIESYEIPAAINKFLSKRFSKKIIIVKDEYSFKDLCVDGVLDEAACNLISDNEDAFCPDKINVVSVAMVKGLEFDSVFVIGKAMTEQEKYIAATRAIRELYFTD